MSGLEKLVLIAFGGIIVVALIIAAIEFLAASGGACIGIFIIAAVLCLIGAIVKGVMS